MTKQKKVWIVLLNNEMIGAYLSKPTHKQLLEFIPSDDRAGQREMLEALQIESVNVL